MSNNALNIRIVADTQEDIFVDFNINKDCSFKNIHDFLITKFNLDEPNHKKYVIHQVSQKKSYYVKYISKNIVIIELKHNMKKQRCIRDMSEITQIEDQNDSPY